MKKLCVFIFLFSSVYVSHAEVPNLDSLKQQVEKRLPDSLHFKALMSMANYYQDTKFDSLFFYAKEGLDFGIKLNNIKMQSHSWSIIGQRQYLLGNYPAALEILFKALQLAESVNDSLGLARSHNLIGITYKEYGEYEEAIKHFYICKEISEKINNTTNIMFSNMNLGQSYCFMNKPDTALQFAQVAYSTGLKIHSTWTGVALINLALIHAKLDHRELALVNFKEGIADFKGNYGNSRFLSKGYLYLADFFKTYHMTDSAIYYAHQSMMVAKAVPYLKGIADAGKFLAVMYDSLQLNDSAYLYQKIFIASNDSLNSRAKVAGVENLTLMEQSRQQERQQASLKSKEEHNQNIQYALIALGIITFIILFLSLSHSVIVNEKWISFFGVLGLLVVFEFINLLIHPKLASITHESPLLMLLALVTIASLLIPIHHRLEKWIKEKMTAKNKLIRLANAKKTIEELERENENR